jgi:adenylate cyclase
MSDRVDTGNEERWRSYLTGSDPAARAGRAIWTKLPSPPRCELCAAPFKGPFVPLLRLIGKTQFTKNPRYCQFCLSRLIAAKGGAEVPMTALFADVRGSTPLAEKLGPTGTYNVIDRFYTTGVDVLVRGGAMVDRFMGDQVVGYFVPLYAREHARNAIETGLDLLNATGHGRRRTPWIPVGVGVHTGTAFVGTVGRAG